MEPFTILKTNTTMLAILFDVDLPTVPEHDYSRRRHSNSAFRKMVKKILKNAKNTMTQFIKIKKSDRNEMQIYRK